MYFQINEKQMVEGKMELSYNMPQVLKYLNPMFWTQSYSTSTKYQHNGTFIMRFWLIIVPNQRRQNGSLAIIIAGFSFAVFSPIQSTFSYSAFSQFTRWRQWLSSHSPMESMDSCISGMFRKGNRLVLSYNWFRLFKQHILCMHCKQN